jgi:arsenite methyltransferase
VIKPRDLLFQQDITDSVRRAYAAIPTGAGEVAAQLLYSADELGRVPSGAIAWALGVASPVRQAGLRRGETVLDVGSGGGIDTILAAHEVGPGGRAIGLDMLAEMCERAGLHAHQAGVDAWTEFLQGQMEAIPLPDGSVDVVISNGVLNLSARKSRALAEIDRVLRPGGRLCVADLTVNDDLPPRVLGSEAAWAGCVSGAMSERVFLTKLSRTGFEDISLGQRTPFGLDHAALYPLFTPEIIMLMRRLIPTHKHGQVATCVIAKARKPI